jgi:transposase-like protein
MARPARHKIKLSSEERSELERTARAEKRPWRDVQRARIVVYAADGLPDTEIASRLDTSAGIVGRWRRRFHEDRLEGLKDRPRAGRPRQFPPGAGRRGHRDRLRAAAQARPAAVALHAH